MDTCKGVFAEALLELVLVFFTDEHPSPPKNFSDCESASKAIPMGLPYSVVAFSFAGRGCLSSTA